VGSDALGGQTATKTHELGRGKQFHGWAHMGWSRAWQSSQRLECRSEEGKREGVGGAAQCSQMEEKKRGGPRR
jgi:hypothetical protein